jgi:hypothetical protein
MGAASSAWDARPSSNVILTAASLSFFHGQMEAVIMSSSRGVDEYDPPRMVSCPDDRDDNRKSINMVCTNYMVPAILDRFICRIFFMIIS